MKKTTDVVELASALAAARAAAARAIEAARAAEAAGRDAGADAEAAARAAWADAEAYAWAAVLAFARAAAAEAADVQETDE